MTTYHSNNNDFKDKAVSNIILLPVEIRPDSQLYAQISVRGPFFRYEHLKSPGKINYNHNTQVNKFNSLFKLFKA